MDQNRNLARMLYQGDCPVKAAEGLDAGFAGVKAKGGVINPEYACLPNILILVPATCPGYIRHP